MEQEPIFTTQMGFQVSSALAYVYTWGNQFRN